MSRRGPPVSRKVSSSTRVPLPQTRGGSQIPSSSAAQAPTLPASSAARTLNAAPTQEENVTNIQVVIRCRGRNSREQAENSPIIVETSGPRSEEVTIETALPQSTFGVYTPAPTRTYPFDRVFGPEADQALVYHDIVAPVLEEVLNGYNCTLFAYGQTGTGKTYTMQGDLSPTLTGNPSADAGIIPRTLHKLFLHLENNIPDYSVKVSFVELYNEELRDLLAPDLKDPVLNSQSSGVAPGSGLKIFDDAAKKGTFIQGLEETHVRDAQDAIQVLRKGSERRQIAATKFNDHSSRSHSIFALTVYTKETSSDGNDLIRTGKLNLVDLAGSENIGRSGAENKRAREAGMINQSLLTLNRVITALVERNSHVPYRESKLTRLLQDSLGGRTKTCIIATISPARCNMEETLSTLDYALQAKAIRNRPELNSRVARNALLKEHASEVARLKADLVAAREKNGVYVSPERWREIESAQEGGKTVREELRIQAEVAQRQCRALREELDAQGAVLVKRTNELDGTKQELELEQRHLVDAKREVSKLRAQVEEEKIVRQAFENNELTLDRVAVGLRDTARTGVTDVQGLFDKIARNNELLAGNAGVITGFSQKLQSEAAELAARVEDFLKSHSSISHRIKSQAESFQAIELDASHQYSQLIDGHLRLLDATATKIQETEKDSDVALDALRSAIARTNEGIKSTLEQWSVVMSRECSALFGELAVQQEKHVGEADKALKIACGLVETVVVESKSYIEEHLKPGISQMHQLAKQASDSEIGRLRHQNELLTSLLETESIRSEKMRDQVTAQLVALIAGFTKESHQGLCDAVATVRQGMKEAEGALNTFTTAHDAEASQVSMMTEDLVRTLHAKEQDGAQTKEEGVKAIKQAKASFEDGNSRARTAINAAVTGQGVDIGRQLSGFNESSSHALELFNSSKVGRIDSIQRFTIESKESFKTVQNGLATSSQNLQQTMSAVINHTTLLRNSCQTYKSSIGPHIAAVEQTSKDILSDVKTQDAPTGLTPRKRRWDYVDSWALTGDRESILRTWRNHDPTPSLSTSITATDDLKSEPGATPEKDLAVAIGQTLIEVDSVVPDQCEVLVNPEPQSDVDMSDVPAVQTKTGRPSSAIPAPSRMRRSTIVPGFRSSGVTDENIATRSKRLKR